MSISGTSESRNCDPTQIVAERTGSVDTAVRDGFSMRDLERELSDRLLAVGFQPTGDFLGQQGDGDCGETCESSGKTLHRSEIRILYDTDLLSSPLPRIGGEGQGEGAGDGFWEVALIIDELTACSGPGSLPMRPST